MIQVERRRCLVLLLPLLAMMGAAGASAPIIWEQATQREFQNGDPTNVSIASQGYLLLAPAVETLYESYEPLLWCLATDSHGNIFAGSGNDGKLFKVDASGQGTVFFDAEELEVHSLALDASDNVYAATFPNGKIYKITPDGQSSLFFEPEALITASDESEADQYIWSLTVDTGGNLYAGTGGNGRVYKIDPNGRAYLLAQTEEAHIVSLAMDPAGNLIAGTDPNGRIYRISPSGDLSVLYDSPYREIRAILTTPSGTIYAGAVNEPRGRIRRPTAPPPTPQTNRSGGTQQGGEGVLEVTAPVTGAGQATTSVRGGRSNGGMVYRICSDGMVQEWWSSREDESLSLALQDDGTLLVGTGPRGIVYEVNGRNKSTKLVRLRESQVTAFGRTMDNRITIASSNLGNLFQLSRNPVKEGSFESEVKDTGGTSSWGQIRWDGQTPQGTGIRLYSRSGNTDKPDKTWSAWGGPYSRMSGEAIKSPSGRFIQWKAVLTTSNSKTPVVNSVSVAYLPRNVAPTVNEVTVYEPGVYLREPGGGGGEQNGQDLPPKVAERIRGRSANGRGRQPSMGAPSYRKGMRTVIVNASDSNNDKLSYAIYFRGEGELQWKLLRDDLERPAYSWDSETLPDGMYTVKLVVSDAPANPPTLAMDTEMVSDPFLIDNTSPQIAKLSAARSNPHRFLTFTVEDAASPIYKVEYAIDGGDWWVIYPDDGVSDSMMETFTLSLDDLVSGEHTVAIRAKEVSNNIGTGKQVFTIPE